jgi:hypothetical protein
MNPPTARPLLPALVLGFAAGVAHAEPTPVELGRVGWGRDVDAGIDTGRRTGKPVLLLFQEIPGCATCKNFGRGPLSHPLLVDAIETEFVAVAVYNNRPGADAAALQRFGEPAWNNPVLRFFAGDRKEILPRRDGIWDAPAVAARLVEALAAAGRQVPPYLALAADEVRAGEAATATFGMHCFWQGEAGLGSIRGVIATRAGHLDGSEVVEVTYVPGVLAYTDLLEAAIRCDCAARVFAHDEAQLAAARRRLGERAAGSDARAREASDADQKWHLRRSALRHVPITPAQAARVNAELAAGRDPLVWLSPRQRELARRIETASRSEPRLLAGLEPPRDTLELHDYEIRLRQLLDGADTR